MGLEDLVNRIQRKYKLIEKYDNLYYASLAFLTVNVLDAVSTSLNCNEYNTHQERNEFARYLMDQLGVNTGLIVHTAIITTAVLGAGYALNKGAELLNRYLSNRIRLYDDVCELLVRNFGSRLVYEFSLSLVPTVIHNFSQYFS